MPEDRVGDMMSQRGQYDRLLPARHASRERGIALMVVFILFVILVLVVTQLQYSTKIEEELAEVRATETMGTFAVAAVACHILTFLAEDFLNGHTGASALPNTDPGMTAPPPQDGEPPPDSGVARERTMADAGAGGGGAVGPGTNDALLNRIFTEDTKSINGVNVKFVIRDNERMFNLNRIWAYPRVVTDSLTEEADLEELESRQDGQNPADGESKNEASGRGRIENIDPRDLLREVEELADSLNGADVEWVPPTEEQRDLAREMLTRVIDLTITLNEDRGFLYRFPMPGAAVLAASLEDYCFMRRSEPTRNSINLVSELLNLPELPPELFYGPVPDIVAGEEFTDFEEMFVYSKDEFGDLVGKALYASDDWLLAQEDRMVEFENLMSMADSPFQHFPELGGALGNPLTRSMKEYPEDVEGLGLLVPPTPIGLRDVFCTHSTGKININTASSTVIYALLLALDEDDAMKVALDLEEYRYMYQPEEEDPEDRLGEATDSLGPPRPTRTLETADDELLDADMFGGVSDVMGGLDAMSGLENPETNYFTDLGQIVWIDGQDGGPDDLLTNQDGIEIVDSDFRTPFQNVRDDLQKVAVFGSTYFTATLKTKTEDSPVVKEGNLLIHRDLEKRRIEIIQWKELER